MYFYCIALYDVLLNGKMVIRLVFVLQDKICIILYFYVFYFFLLQCIVSYCII